MLVYLESRHSRPVGNFPSLVFLVPTSPESQAFRTKKSLVPDRPIRPIPLENGEHPTYFTQADCNRPSWHRHNKRSRPNEKPTGLTTSACWEMVEKISHSLRDFLNCTFFKKFSGELFLNFFNFPKFDQLGPT